MLPAALARQYFSHASAECEPDEEHDHDDDHRQVVKRFAWLVDLTLDQGAVPRCLEGACVPISESRLAGKLCMAGCAGHVYPVVAFTTVGSHRDRSPTARACPSGSRALRWSCRFAPSAGAADLAWPAKSGSENRVDASPGSGERFEVASGWSGGLCAEGAMAHRERRMRHTVSLVQRMIVVADSNPLHCPLIGHLASMSTSVQSSSRSRMNRAFLLVPCVLCCGSGVLYVLALLHGNSWGAAAALLLLLGGSVIVGRFARARTTSLGGLLCLLAIVLGMQVVLVDVARRDVASPMSQVLGRLIVSFASPASGQPESSVLVLVLVVIAIMGLGYSVGRIGRRSSPRGALGGCCGNDGC